MSTTCGCGGEHVLVSDDRESRCERIPPARSERRRRSTGPVREVRTVRLQRQLLANNNQIAGRTRRLLAEIGVTMLNLIGAPGSGKTTLLESTIHRLREDRRRTPFVVLEGAQSNSIDTRRIEAVGGRALQITTGARCHLDASMVAETLRTMTLVPGTMLFVENVGNLVCPSLFDLGEAAKVVVMSVTQGEDAPLKYPHAFCAADLLVLTKTDLLPHVTFDPKRCLANAHRMNPRLAYVPVSALRPDGVDEWSRWVEGQWSRSRAPR